MKYFWTDGYLTQNDGGWTEEQMARTWKNKVVMASDYEALSQDRERTQVACRVVTAKAEKLAELLQQAVTMAEFGDINADMEDDGIGWKQWYRDVSAILGRQSETEGDANGR